MKFDNSHMTDQEIVEALATGLMGWAIWEPDGSEGEDRRKTDVERYRKGEIKGFRLRNQLIKKWNPLTDWNHTMQVVEQMKALSMRYAFAEQAARMALKDWPSNVNAENFYQGVATGLCDMNQRIICLAALSTLSQNNDAIPN